MPNESLAKGKTEKPVIESKGKEFEEEEESSSEEDESSDDDDDDESDSDEDDDDDDIRTQATNTRDKVLQRLKVMYK